MRAPHEITRTLQRAGDLFTNTERKPMLQMNIEEHAVSRNVPDSPAAVVPNRREQAWLNARLERGKKERFSEVVKVTPGLAAAMLKLNLANRPIVKRQVALHVDRLMRGDFVLHHHGIAFAKSGALNDGQHRLTGIAESGVSGMLQVTFGAEREEFLVIDQGKRRGADHMLAIAGETHWTLRASVASILYRIKNKLPDSPDPQVVFDYAMSQRGKDMDDALRVGRNMSKVTSPTAAALAYYWIKTYSKRGDRLDEFFANLPTGQNLTHPRLKLREWLRGKAIKSGGGATTVLRAAVIINCWNTWLAGNRTFSTEWNYGIRLPEPR